MFLSFFLQPKRTHHSCYLFQTLNFLRSTAYNKMAALSVYKPHNWVFSCHGVLGTFNFFLNLPHTYWSLLRDRTCVLTHVLFDISPSQEKQECWNNLSLKGSSLFGHFHQFWGEPVFGLLLTSFYTISLVVGMREWNLNHSCIISNSELLSWYFGLSILLSLVPSD